MEEAMLDRRCLQKPCKNEATVHFSLKDWPETPQDMVENTLTCDAHIMQVMRTGAVVAFHRVAANPCCWPGSVWYDKGCELDDSGEELPSLEGDRRNVVPVQG